MPIEASHIQLLEYEKEAIPYINWMMEDLFCRYGVSIPYFILDFSFPDYSARPDWVSPYIPELPEFYFPSISCAWPQWLPTNGFNFGSDWGKWEYNLPWFNELLGLAFDEAGLPRWQLPDFSPESIRRLNSLIPFIYEQKERNVLADEDILVTENVDIKFSSTFICEEGNNRLYKDSGGVSGGTYQDAIDRYNNSPRYIVQNLRNTEVFNGSISNPPHWNAYNVHFNSVYLTFDTSALSGKTLSSATLRVHIYHGYYGCEITGLAQSICLFQHSYGTLDDGDWTGGTLISTTSVDEISNNAYNELDVPINLINQSGNTQFRFHSALDNAGGYPPEPRDPCEMYRYYFYVQTGHVNNTDKAELIVKFT